MDNSFSYLNTPSRSLIPPPVSSKLDILPIDQLGWEDFEKLCLRLAQEQFSIDDCEIYGVKGQKQYGIDIFARKENNKYKCYQCKRYQSVSENDLDKAIDEFKSGKWFDKTDEFVFCTTYPLDTTQLQDKFNDLKQTLNSYGTELIKWDKIQILRTLKDYPQIVYDFFGAEWVKEFIGEEALEKVTSSRKLDSNQVIKYRKELYEVYLTVFQQYDPGLPLKKIEDTSFLLKDRFVIPEVFEKEHFNRFLLPIEQETKNSYEKFSNLHTPDDDYYTRKEERFLPKKFEVIKDLKFRKNIDIILAQKRKTIILGDPGSGKSTLLRYIILDILSEKPVLVNISKKWGELLPIWLPFAFITKNLSKNENYSLSDLLKLWFESIDKGNLFSLVADALHDERLLLLIDGVDEWTNQSAAEQAISKIEIQTELSNAVVLYSGRPYGYKALEESLLDIQELYLAPFSKQQQKKCIKSWYERWSENLDISDPDLPEIETNSFLQELDKSAEFATLAENPLLLNILITLRLNESALPKNRIKALEEITDYLISKHPKKRKTSASIIDDDDFEFQLSDVFLELAYYIQTDGLDNVIEKNDAYKVIERFLIEEMGYNIAKSRMLSRKILDIDANSIGIILEKSNRELSFVHRQFQEFLAAKYLLESEKEITLKVLQERAKEISWHQTLYLFFGLIPIRKKSEFLEYFDAIEPDQASDKYISFLKYRILLNSNNSPHDRQDEYFQKITEEFEFETNVTRKEALWDIILTSLYTSRLRKSTIDYVSNYFPNAYKFQDHRINILLNIPTEKLPQFCKEYLIKNLINGNTYQKLEASNAINSHIKDDWLCSRIMDILEFCFNPEVVPFALNSIISKEIDESIKLKVYEKYKYTEHPNISLFSIKLKVHLKKQEESDMLDLVKVFKSISYELEDEYSNLLIKGWPENQKLLALCLESTKRHFAHQSLINSSIAWKILFVLFNKEETVLDRVVEELKTEEYPFIGIDKYVSWDYFSNYFENNTKLIPVIDEWIERQKYNEPEIAYASLIGKTDFAKKYLINNLPKSGIPHWFVMALVEGWPEDIEVLEFLKNYFKQSERNSHFAAQYIDSVFKNEKETGIKLLEDIIFDRSLVFRDRAIEPLIKLDKEYFRNKILKKLIEEELSLFPKDNFREYYNALSTVVRNYHEEPVVEHFFFSNLSDHSVILDLLMKFWPNREDVIERHINYSSPLPLNLRILLIDKIGERGVINDKILNLLSKFDEESNEIVKSRAALSFFSFLRNNDIEKIISIAQPKIFYRGPDYELQRQIAFCGYLITKKLDEYYQVEEEGTKERANPGFSFDSYSIRSNVEIIKLIINNFDYLYSETSKDFSKLSKFSKLEEEKVWGFLARYSDQSSQTFPYLIDYINSHQNSINNQYLIDFLYRTSPQSNILKSILLRLVNEKKDSSSPFYGKILGENFNYDNSVLKNVSNFDLENFNTGKILALCIGWPDSKILKDSFNRLIEKEYCPHPYEYDAVFYLKFLFRDYDNIFNFFDEIIVNYNDLRNNHKYFIQPMMNRIKRDPDLQQLIKNKLLTTDSISFKISFYSILSTLNKVDNEIVLWRNKELERVESQYYGYNIVTNEVTPLVEILNNQNYFSIF